MAKPIFIMIIPNTCSNLNAVDSIEQELHDYHCLFIWDGSRKEYEFKVFSDKEIKPIKLEELKKLIKIKL